MSLDLPALRAAVAAHGVVIRVLVLAAAGSVPREAGASMLVWDGGASGTIGGGRLERDAADAARAMLGGGPRLRREAVPLGPRLGQCCGGSVTLAWERFDAASLPAALPYARALAAPRGAPPELPPGSPPVERDGWIAEGAPAPPRPLWVWGAGHVGRAVVSVLAPWPGAAITWVDLAPELFPDPPPPGVAVLPAAEPPAAVPLAPRGADHLVMTRDHALDLALCHALLGHGFASLGLIGSQTKWARFRGRLLALGHAPAAVARIACPIGEPRLGKHPQAIAVGVAAGLMGAGVGARKDAAG